MYVVLVVIAMVNELGNDTNMYLKDILRLYIHERG